jgi:protein-disulfide isomerase
MFLSTSRPQLIKVLESALQPFFIMLFLYEAGAVRAQTDDSVLATVNGRAIRQKEVDKAVVAQTLPLEEKLYAIRKAALENLIISRVLEDEAKKRGITVAALREQLSAGPVEVTEAQVEAAYVENASFFASISPDEAKERLRLDLQSQKRMEHYRAGIEKLKAAARVEVILDHPRVPQVSADPAAPSRGPANAAVTIVEYSDFECPYCRSVQTSLEQVLRLYEKDVRLVFKHLPLRIHEHAFPAALAAVCAARQDKFWRYHDALFASQELDRQTLEALAKTTGLDVPQFNMCLSSDEASVYVQRDAREAFQLGINSTPTFIINGRIARGALTFDEFQTIIDQELRSSGSDPKPQPQDLPEKDLIDETQHLTPHFDLSYVPHLYQSVTCPASKPSGLAEG